jgi:hypothetical protein
MKGNEWQSGAAYWNLDELSLAEELLGQSKIDRRSEFDESLWHCPNDWISVSRTL